MEKENKVRRYYLGVDWADEFHQVWVSAAEGKKVAEMTIEQSMKGLSEFGRWLHECKGEGIELWAAIEKPQGRIVDFLLDHGVVVYPVNPKTLDRARDRFRMSQSKSDSFDAYVLAEFLRTDHVHLRALQPDSEQAQALKMLTRDHHRLGRHKTRLLNQIEVTLKEYYPRPLEVFSDLQSQIALDFLQQYPTPRALSELTRRNWNRFAKREHRLGEQRGKELWEKLSQPMLWAELGDAKSRWQSFRHLQAEAGGVPVTKASGKSRVVQFRFACNKLLRYASYWLSFNSLNRCEWANKYYRDQRCKGHSHPRALRALGAKWLKIIFVMWRDHQPYDENLHLANIARQHMRQA
jgi:transposase